MKVTKLLKAKIVLFGLLIFALGGCTGGSSRPEKAGEEEPWVVVREMDLGFPPISTAFYDSSLGLTTDTRGGIYQTESGGEDWTYVQAASGSRVALEFVNQDLVWHIGVGGAVLRSDDRGVTWSHISMLPHSGHIEFASFVDDHNGWAASTERDEFWVTDDGAVTWSAQPLPPGMGVPAALHLRTPQDSYLLDRDGVLFSTTDGGLKWVQRGLDLPEGWRIPTLNHTVFMRFLDPDHGVVLLNLVGKGEGRVLALRTADGGDSWHEERLDLPMGLFNLTRDGLYLTHNDLLENGKLTLLRSTSMESGARDHLTPDLSDPSP